MSHMAPSCYPASNTTTMMEAHHIYRLAAIEAENRLLVAQNQAKEQIIEFLLAQLIQANSTRAPPMTIEHASSQAPSTVIEHAPSQTPSIATGHDPTQANRSATCFGPNPFDQGLLLDARPGSGYERKPLPTQLRASDNATLDEYWNALTPHPSSNINEMKPITKPADGTLAGCISTVDYSDAAAAPHPAHPAMQASMKHEVEHSRSDDAASTQHVPEASVTSPGSIFRKSPVLALHSPEMRAEASPFLPTGYTLRFMHSVERPLSQHNKSNVAYDAAEGKEEARSLVMYQPVQHDTDAQRTVLITGFPLNGKLADLLTQIHTGLVYSITVADSSAISDRASVMLIFLHGKAARAFVADMAAKSLTVPGTDGVDHILNVRMLESATYPIPSWLYRCITEQGATRVVRISGLPAELTCQAFTAFVSERGTRRHGLASVYKDDDGNFVAEFTSVINASKAVDRLLSYPDFCNAIWSHLPDPCDVDAPASGGAGQTESEGSGSTTPKLNYAPETPGSKDTAKEGGLQGAEVSEVDKDGLEEDLI